MRRRCFQGVIILGLLWSLSTLLSPVTTEKETKPVTIGEISKVYSDILSEERPLWIYIPGSYTTSRSGYPVLYLLDGSANFHHVSGLVDFMSTRFRIPRMIVVAIPNTDRNRDFLPTSVNDHPPNPAADKFLDFLNNELISYIDKHYRTVPYRILCGHSYGGLFAIYSLLNRPTLFNAFIIISPSVYWDDRLMFKQAGIFFSEHRDVKKTLFLSCAGGDKDEIRSATHDFAELLKRKAPAGFEWDFQFLEKEDHGSTVHRSVYNGLEFIYADWPIAPLKLLDMPLKDIRQHFRRLSNKYGYEIPELESIIDFKGYILFEKNDIESAVKVFQFNVDLFPESTNARLSLGHIYETAGRIESAIKNFENAAKLAEQYVDPRLPHIRKHLSLLLEKMQADRDSEGSKKDSKE